MSFLIGLNLDQYDRLKTGSSSVLYIFHKVMFASKTSSEEFFRYSKNFIGLIAASGVIFEVTWLLTSITSAII